jgi:hypothetical protein
MENPSKIHPLTHSFLPGRIAEDGGGAVESSTFTLN